MNTSSHAPTWSLRRIYHVDDMQIAQLADVLVNCVQGGASVSFMLPLTHERAEAFWRDVAHGVATKKRALLIAEDAHGVCGTVHLVLDQPENQPHRADVSKMLVHQRVRREGLGAALMRAVEDMARDCHKSVLVLDTATGGDADRLYERMGWQRVGDIPHYALFPKGESCSATFFYRHIAPRG